MNAINTGAVLLWDRGNSTALPTSAWPTIPPHETLFDEKHRRIGAKRSVNVAFEIRQNAFPTGLRLECVAYRASALKTDHSHSAFRRQLNTFLHCDSLAAGH